MPDDEDQQTGTRLGATVRDHLYGEGCCDQPDEWATEAGEAILGGGLRHALAELREIERSASHALTPGSSPAWSTILSAIRSRAHHALKVLKNGPDDEPFDSSRHPGDEEPADA